MQASTTSQRRSRKQLWLLVLVFFAPLAVSFLLYYGGNGWRPAGSVNRGDLVDPARPLPDAVLSTPEGTATAPDFLRGRWSVVFAGEGACDTRCRQALTDMRQVRLALNEDMTRVQRVFLYTGACCDETYFAAEQGGLVRANVDGDAGQALLANFPEYDGVPVLGAGRLYVVDPLGNLMMSHAADADAKGLLDDLERLLRLSHIG